LSWRLVLFRHRRHFGGEIIGFLLDAFAHFVGTLVTWILMPLLYVVLFVPVGLVLRATGKLRLERRPDDREVTYWRSPRVGESAGDRGAGRWQGDGLERYRRQF